MGVNSCKFTQEKAKKVRDLFRYELLLDKAELQKTINAVHDHLNCTESDSFRCLSTYMFSYVNMFSALKDVYFLQEESIKSPVLADYPLVSDGFTQLKLHLKEMVSIRYGVHSGRPLVFCLREQVL